MPPKTKITKENILSASLDLVREKGIDALNARELALKLKCSTQPIFSNFASMDELKNEVFKIAERLYVAHRDEAMKEEKYPPYKASGIAYIQFAKDEKELFKWLFMRDRTGENVNETPKWLEPVIDVIQEANGFSRDEALIFHLENWIFVHGIAVMYATDFYAPEIQLVSRMISEVYMGVSGIYAERDSKK